MFDPKNNSIIDSMKDFYTTARKVTLMEERDATIRKEQWEAATADARAPVKWASRRPTWGSQEYPLPEDSEIEYVEMQLRNCEQINDRQGREWLSRRRYELIAKRDAKREFLIQRPQRFQPKEWGVDVALTESGQEKSLADVTLQIEARMTAAAKKISQMAMDDLAKAVYGDTQWNAPTATAIQAQMQENMVSARAIQEQMNAVASANMDAMMGNMLPPPPGRMVTAAITGIQIQSTNEVEQLDFERTIEFDD